MTTERQDIDVTRIASAYSVTPQHALGSVTQWLAHWEERLGPPPLYGVALQSASEIEAVWRAVAGCPTDARTLAACGLVAQFRDGDHWRILHLEEATRRAKYRESRRLAGEASAAARRRRAGTAKPGAKP